MSKTDKQQRIHTANAFLTVIATCGRRFFNHEGQTWPGRGKEQPHKGHISHFHADTRGHIYLEDGYTGRKCYRRPTFPPKDRHPDFPTLGWYGRNFGEGGTLNQVCQALDDFIRTGERPQIGLYWSPDYCNGDLWGYGDDMQQVREAFTLLFDCQGVE